MGALRSFLLVALLVTSLAGGLRVPAGPSPYVGAVALDVAAGEHGYAHDHDAEPGPDHVHHVGDHSHVTLGLPVVATERSRPVRVVRRRRATTPDPAPAPAFDFDRPPRTSSVS